MNDDNLDLLDLDDGAGLDTLPEATPFAAPRPKKPWLLLGIGLVVIILATYIIIRTIGSDNSSSVDVDLDAPIVVDVPPVADDNMPAPVVPTDAPIVVPAPTPVQVADPAPVPAPTPAPVQEVVPAQVTPGVPVRMIEDRKDVQFNPDKPAPVAKPAPKPQAKQPAAAVKKPAPKTAKKPVAQKRVAASNGSWYVQFGSYSTRSAAESAQRKLRAEHAGLFQGRQFVILAAVMKDGSTKYRLRIAFSDSNEANGFCRNAKSDGLDCYVAK